MRRHSASEELAPIFSDASSSSFVKRWRKETAELRTTLATTPATLADWTTIFARTRERLSTLGVLLHELEETDPPAAMTADTWSRAVADADYWLEHAGATISRQEEELEQLLPPALLRGLSGGLSGTFAPPSPGLTLPELVRWAATWPPSLTRDRTSPDLRDALERGRLHALRLIERAERLSIAPTTWPAASSSTSSSTRSGSSSPSASTSADGRLDAIVLRPLASEARLASFLAIATRRGAAGSLVQARPAR